MGYVTRYSLETDSANHSEIMDDLRAKYTSASYALDDNGNTIDECKWYDHESDLLAFSEGWPSTLFTLEGAGEEHPDYWRKYFKNGKLQRAKGEIVYPVFDERRLNVPFDVKGSMRW